MVSVILLAALTAVAAAYPQATDPVCANPPAKGLSGPMGGLFGMTGGVGGGGMPDILGIFTTGSQSKADPSKVDKADSGPYPAKYFTDASLPAHTIYAPIKPPAEPMPVIVWGNGACFSAGTMFLGFLQEIASHGFVVIANGAASSSGGGAGDLLGGLGGLFSTPAQLTESVDWIYKGGDAGKYGKIDKNKIAVAGQSCGGLESYSAAYHDDRIKYIGIFNSGLLNPARTCLLKEFKVPIAYFLGGPKDIAYVNGERDYSNLPPGLPAIKMSLDAGHMATYYDKRGGKFGQAAVAYFKWVLKGDDASKQLFLNPQSPFIADGWNLTSKNWK